jgi:hypothetical protein
MTALIQGTPFKLLICTHKLKPIYRVLLSGDAPTPMAIADLTDYVINMFTSLNGSSQEVVTKEVYLLLWCT